MAVNSSQAQKRQISNRGITSIKVRGYKSLVEEHEIEIRPLTILAGANSSGKSSIIQPILMLKQTLDATYDPGPLLLYGPNVKTTSTEQIFSKLPGRSSVESFSIEVVVDQNKKIEHIFSKKSKKGIELERFSYRDRNQDITLQEELTAEEIRLLIPESMREIENAFSKSEITDFSWRVVRNRCFLVASFHSSRFAVGTTAFAFPSIESLSDYFREIIHVPGLRGNPERTYKTTAIGLEFPGTFENYVASVVHYWQTNQHNRLRELGSSLEALGLTWKVEARQIDDTQVELRVGRMPHSVRGGARDTVNIADVGFGVSQILPVLVALLLARRGQVVYIEQPEIHLHPRAQSVMAKILADAAKKGVKVIVETHSSLLIRSIQTIVARGDLPREYVKLHWFTRRTTDGVTEITSADLDENGAFGDWPTDFEEVELSVERDYLDSIEENFK